MSDKNDVFVGNLAFNTTEEQLKELFSFIGPVKNVRMLTDKETGKPKGFAFVEFYDNNSAVSAIKHLDQSELNGRKIKVGIPSQNNNVKDSKRDIGALNPQQMAQRLAVEQNVINSLKLHEAWDILDAMKKLVMEDSRGTKVRSLLEAHPQIIHAIYEIEKRLGIVLPAHLQQQQVPGQGGAEGVYQNSTMISSATRPFPGTGADGYPMEGDGVYATGQGGDYADYGDYSYAQTYGQMDEGYGSAAGYGGEVGAYGNYPEAYDQQSQQQQQQQQSYGVYGPGDSRDSRDRGRRSRFSDNNAGGGYYE